MKIYEVDEAANRIREEVDVDANVIFGATQDESLDGIIRVSVVATGLEPITEEQANSHAASIDQRLALMADRLRAQMASRAQAAAAAPPAPAPEPLVQAPIAHVQPALVQPVPVAPPQPAPAPEPVAIQPDLIVETVQARPAFFAQPIVEEPRNIEEPRTAEPFIPPAPERAIVRPQRMPSVDELPRPAQAMLSASREEAVAAPPAPVEKRMTLMQRLASVGLGVRRDEDGAQQAEANPAISPQMPELPAQPSATHAMYARRPAAPAAAAYRPAQGNLDPQGRIPAPTRSFEDDQLEIPAFLRRQSK
jgi:cell division protein FtsZ